jgi:hypothetical protein
VTITVNSTSGMHRPEWWSATQLADLDDAKRSGMKRVDTLERAASCASKTSQQFEAQLQGLERELKEAHAATRLAEFDFQKARATAVELYEA